MTLRTRTLAGTALVALSITACGGEPGEDAAGTPAVRLVELQELEAAVGRHLERGGLVALWATW